MALNATELFLCDQQARTNPPFALIATVPAFHVQANSFDDREGGFDHVGAGEREP